MNPVLLTAAVTLTAIIAAAAVWVYVMIPTKWGNFEDPDGYVTWWCMGWIIPFGAGAVPIVMLWTHL